MWNPVPCDHHNGNITGYVVMFRKLDNGVSRNVTTRGSTMEYMISGLEPSTEYEIQVAAFTIAAGPFTNDSLLASTLGTCLLQTLCTYVTTALSATQHFTLIQLSQLLPLPQQTLEKVAVMLVE